MYRVVLAFGTVTLLLASTEAARGDAIPDDECRAWEHWEGAHSGGCRFGPRCSVSAPGASGDGSSWPASTAATLVTLGVLQISRRKTTAERLRRFDAATARLRGRDATVVGAPEGGRRGWTRDELYDRPRPRAT